jgi:hypothetical protein
MVSVSSARRRAAPAALIGVLTLLALGQPAASAPPGPGVYLDRAEFDRAASRLERVTFEGLARRNPRLRCEPPVLRVRGVRFAAGEAALFVLHPRGGTPDWRSGATLHPAAACSEVTVTPPYAVTALGFDLVAPGKTTGVFGVTLSTGVGFVVPVQPQPERAFAGVISDRPFTWARVHLPEAGAADGAQGCGLDNVLFGARSLGPPVLVAGSAASTAVLGLRLGETDGPVYPPTDVQPPAAAPEPASSPLLIAGLAGMLLLLRLRRLQARTPHRAG